MTSVALGGKYLARRGRRRARPPLGLWVAGLLLVPVAALAGNPRLEVEPSEIDLGEIVRGESRIAEFTLRNTGDATLEVIDADPACGCTVATFDRTVAAGGTGKLTATLNTSSLEGEVGKSIVLRTNDPHRPKLMLVLRAVILRSVQVLPDERMIVRNYKDGGVGQLLLRRDPSESGALEPTALVASTSWLTARARELDEKRLATDETPPGRPGDWLLEVQVKPGAPYGQHAETLVLETGLRRQPRLEIPVFVDVHPPVAVPNDKIVLRQAPFEEMVILTVRKGLDPTALRAEARPEGLSVVLEPSGGRFYKAHVRWRGGALADPGVVTFTVGQEHVELPVEVATSAP